jgi:YD repeat-containing protein
MNRETINKYDRYQRLVESTSPIGVVTANTYFADGQLESTTVTGKDYTGSQVARTNTYGYDPLGRRNLIVNALDDALDNPTRMTYDKVGNVLSMKDAEGRVTTNTYDPLNRKTESSIQVMSNDLVTNNQSIASFNTSYQC